VPAEAETAAPHAMSSAIAIMRITRIMPDLRNR
jgi:hypothetical protein